MYVWAQLACALCVCPILIQMHPLPLDSQSLEKSSTFTDPSYGELMTHFQKNHFSIYFSFDDFLHMIFPPTPLLFQKKSIVSFMCELRGRFIHWMHLKYVILGLIKYTVKKYSLSSYTQGNTLFFMHTLMKSEQQ